MTGLHDKRRRKARSDLCTAFSTLNRFTKAIDARRHLAQVGTTLWIASGADGGNSSLWSNPSDGERARPSAVRSLFSVAFPMKPRAGARPGRWRSQSAALPNISPALRNRCGNLCGYLPFLWNSEAARRSKNKPLREIANSRWPILAPRLMLTCNPFGRLCRAPPDAFEDAVVLAPRNAVRPFDLGTRGAGRLDFHCPTRGSRRSSFVAAPPRRRGADLSGGESAAGVSEARAGSGPRPVRATRPLSMGRARLGAHEVAA